MWQSHEVFSSHPSQLPTAPVVLPTQSALVFPHSKSIKTGFLFSQSPSLTKNPVFIHLLPTHKKQEPKPKRKPLPKLSYITGSYSSSPLGLLRLETISLLCKIAALQRSHPLPTGLPTHYESFIIYKFFAQKDFTKLRLHHRNS